MSAAKRETVEPGPEALAYGQELRKIFLRLGKPQREVAGLLSIDPSVLSRFFSGKPSKGSAADTIAAKEHADKLIRLVRDSGAIVTGAEETKLHDLRRAAQAASSSQQDRVRVLQEQLDDLQQQLDEAEVRSGTFRGRAQSLEGANSRLEDRVGLLQQRVREEERRAGREHRARVKEQRQREQGDSRADQAERRGVEVIARFEEVEQARDEAEERARLAAWGAEEAAARLGAVVRDRVEAEERAARAVWGADESATRLRALEEQHREVLARAEQESRKSKAALADLAAARKQLTAAAEYARESDAKIEAQQGQLRLLRQEVKVLRRQVRQLTEEATQPVSTPIADVATQVSAVRGDLAEALGGASADVFAARAGGEESLWWGTQLEDFSHEATVEDESGGGSQLEDLSYVAAPLDDADWESGLDDFSNASGSLKERYLNPGDTGLPELDMRETAVWPATPREERLRALQAQSAAARARAQRAEARARAEQEAQRGVVGREGVVRRQNEEALAAREQAELDARQRSAEARAALAAGRDQLSGQDGSRSIGMGSVSSAPSPPAPTPEELLKDLGRTPKPRTEENREQQETAPRAENDTIALTAAAGSYLPPARNQPVLPVDPTGSVSPKTVSGGRAQARRTARIANEESRRGFRRDLLRNGVITLVLTQVVSFSGLLLHTMLASGELPGFRVFSLWFIGSFIFMASVIPVFMSKKTAVKTAAIAITICAVVASFGNDALTAPWLSHTAHKLGTQFAERRDGRSCDTDFCNPNS
ncbi:hypothetical protein [Streptomyces sp. NPDC048256]|uniref:hypothetical protein n=1 Tax=unclassified Streptomyces TaxID=2593676 RepID=UPI0033CA5344